MAVTLLFVCGAALHGQAPALHLPPLDRVLPARAEAIYQSLAARVEAALRGDFQARLFELTAD